MTFTRPATEGGVAIAESREIVEETTRDFEPSTLTRSTTVSLGPIPSAVLTAGDLALHDYAWRQLRDVSVDGEARMIRGKPHRYRYGMRFRNRRLINSGHPQDWEVVDTFTGFVREPDTECPAPDGTDGYEITQDPDEDFSDGDPLGVVSMRVTSSSTTITRALYCIPDATELNRAVTVGKGNLPGVGFDEVLTGTIVGLGGAPRQYPDERREIIIEYVRDAGIFKLAGRPRWRRGYPLYARGSTWIATQRNNETFLNQGAGTVKLERVTVYPLQYEFELVQIVFTVDQFAFLEQTATASTTGRPVMQAGDSETGPIVAVPLWWQPFTVLRDNDDLEGILSTRQLTHLAALGATWIPG